MLEGWSIVEHSWVPVQKAAHMLDVDKQVVYRMIHNGTVIAKRVGGMYRVAITNGVVIQIVNGEHSYRPRHLKDEDDE